MDKFIHQNNVQITRKNAFELAQLEMFRNISNRIIPMLESYGVIMDVTGDGLSAKTSLKVESPGSGQLKIKAGYAILGGALPEDHTLIVLEEDITINIMDYINYTGTAYVCLEGLAEMRASNHEIYLPGYLGGTDQIFLLSEDSAAITISPALDLSKIVLAKILLTSSALAFTGHSNLTLNEPSTRPYIDSDDEEIIITQSTLGTGVPDDWTLLIESEQVEYRGFSFSSHALTIVARGANDTVATIHKNGITMSVSPIIDMRQTNKAKLSTSQDSIVQKIARGIINYGDGNGDRFFKTMRVPDVPNTPVIDAGQIALIWLNKQTTGGNMSATAIQKVNQAKGVKGRVDNITANITAQKESLAGATGTEAVAINRRISELRAALIEARTELTDASTGLQEYTAAFSSAKKFVAACAIEQPGLIDNEQIVRYEAEVFYMPVNASAIDKITNIPSRIYTPVLMPDGCNSYGDYVYSYDDQPDVEFRTLLMPISPNEKIKFRVRAITEHNMYSAWSSYVIYVFDELNSADSELALDLDKIARGYNPYEEGIINLETIELLKQMRADFIAGISQVQGYDNDLSSLSTAVDTLRADIESMKVNIREILARLSGIDAHVANFTGQSSTT